MTRIAVSADPNHPNGGYAVLTVTGTEIGETAEVIVQNRFTEKYLSQDGWQSAPASFGPYQILRTADGAQLRIGPEIVNQVEEYTELQITVGGATGALNWPDTVPALPGAAAIGGLDIRRASAPLSEETVILPRRQEPFRATRPEPPEAPTPPPDPPKKPRTAWGLLAALVILLGVAGFIWVSWSDQEPEPDVADAPCGDDAVAALKDAAFEHTIAWFARCGDAVTAEAALALVEGAAGEDDATALALFGKLYDAEALDAPVEETIGLSFEDEPVVAAEYYSRARDAGSADGEMLLAALCERLELNTTTLAQSAYRDHCTTPE